MEESTPTSEAPEACKPRKKMKRRGRRLTGISKQRRQANKRERNRVHVLNATIERLRGLIPLFPGEKKPSKTETIRLAALYILHMTELLQTTESDEDDCKEFSFVTFTQGFQGCDTGLDAGGGLIV